MVTVRFERRESPHALTTATPQAIASPRRWPEPWWRVDRHVRAVLGEANGDRLVIATGSGALRLTRVQAEGTRAMTAREFLAGHAMSTGDRLTARP